MRGITPRGCIINYQPPSLDATPTARYLPSGEAWTTPWRKYSTPQYRQFIASADVIFIYSHQLPDGVIEAIRRQRDAAR